MGDYLTRGSASLQPVQTVFSSKGITQQDRIRERELFRFYRPDDAQIDSDGQSPPSSPPNTFDFGDTPPIGNNDVTLAALAQLVALRLGVHRAMINVIGRETQYTLVEATKTLDLVNQTTSECVGDEAWVGSGGQMHKAMSLCENVVALPHDVIDHPFLIIPDLSKDPRFKDRPYVKGPPHYRFYAGTQLCTARGVVIGALCTFAHEPRRLSDTEQNFMSTISDTIMQHLEMKRAAAERDKVTRMSRGLNAFIEGKASQFATTRSRSGSAQRALTGPVTPIGPPPVGNGAHAGTPSGGDTLMAGTAELPGTPSKVRQDSREQHAGQESKEKTAEAASGTTENTIEEQFHATLSRAASILGEALGLGDGGGVVFYDTVARIDTPYPEASSPQTPTEENDPDDWGSFSDGAITPGAFDGMHDFDDAKASILGSMVSARYTKGYPDESYRNLTSRMIAKFLKRYPLGRTWAFDEHGVIPSQDDGATGPDTKTRQVAAAEKEVRKRIEADHLTAIFPGARSLLFIPLWDANLSRHYAGCFAWTTNAMSRFSADIEFSFVTAFGNSVSAEISRLATLDADQRKSDFIGSVSHELRSPLHGVLASAEFLAETKLDSFQSTLVGTIDSCGRTLLDTINHVLDFSKINSLRRTWKKTSKVGKGHTPHGARDQKTLQSSGIMSILGSTDIAAITEEVVDSVYAGKIYAKAFSPADITDLDASGSHRRDSEQPRWPDSSKSDVQVFLDIAPGDYHFVTQPGAIRRIIMNIFGNSLKYTEKGSILIRLWQQNSSEESSRGNKVILTVKDTGKGISTGYLRTRLYTPFAQENDLAPGTGLGLSIVRNIVTMLRGDVSIRSKVGRGTEVRITLPDLTRTSSGTGPGDKEFSKSTLADLKFLRTRPEKLVVGLYGFSQDHGDMQPDVQHLLRQYLEDWCEIRHVAEMKPDIKADIVFVDENLLGRLEQSGLVGADKSVVVLCKNPSPVQAPKGTHTRHYFLLKPFGPYKLAKTIRKCIERARPGVNGRPQSYSASLLPNASTAEVDLHTFNTQTLGGKVTTKEVSGESENGGPDTKTRMSRPRLLDVSPHASYGPGGTDPGNEVAVVDAEPLEERAAKRQDFGQSKEQSDRIKPRLLVVDDNKTNQVLLQTFLRKRGFAADAASDGSIAVREASSKKYDIIFMDISMPVMNGFEATREIRKHEENVKKQYKRDSMGAMRSRPTSRVWQNGSVAMTPSPSVHAHAQFFDPATSAGSEPGSSVASSAGLAKPATPPISPEDDAAKDATIDSLKPALIIALTGLASGRDQSEAFASGVNHYMTKPVSFKEVGRLIDNWMTNGGSLVSES